MAPDDGEAAADTTRSEAMVTRKTLIALGAAGVIVAATGVYGASAQGWGMGGGWGAGEGPANGEFNCPGFGRGGGWGPGMMGGGGPGYGMRGRGGGWGPMMGYGYGRGYGPGAGASQTRNLTVDDVKARLDTMLQRRGNSHLKVGEVKEKDADTIVGDIVTRDNSLVDRFLFNRHTGAIQRDNG
jgi:hypothetical protein